MTELKGRFAWHELITPDIEAAKAFYGQVAGWGAHDIAPMRDMPYAIFTVGEVSAAGLLPLPQPAIDAGVPAQWIGYVAVDSVDAATEAMRAAGGMVLAEPVSLPAIGRIATFADPQKAIISFIEPERAAAEAPPSSGRGHFGWHELAAEDWAGEFDLYSGLTGWSKAEAHDMGPMGTYQLFSAGGETIGGMFNKRPETPLSRWLYYINVGDIDAAAERVATGGGAVLNGPIQVPTGGWVLQATDPQGAAFALLGTRG